MSTIRIGAAVVMLVLVAGGCRSRAKYDYHVQVRNESTGVIRALVLRDAGEERIVTVYETQVYPRARGEVSLPHRPSREKLVLQVDAPNNPGTPARMPLSPGQSVVSVTRDGDAGPIKVERVQNP